MLIADPAAINTNYFRSNWWFKIWRDARPQRHLFKKVGKKSWCFFFSFCSKLKKIVLVIKRKFWVYFIWAREGQNNIWRFLFSFLMEVPNRYNTLDANWTKYLEYRNLKEQVRKYHWVLKIIVFYIFYFIFFFLGWYQRKPFFLN